jgi:hypothetical protein
MASTTTIAQQPHPPQPQQLPEALVARHAACAPFAGRALDAALIAALEAEIARRQASVRGLRFLRQVEIDMDNDARAAIAALRICSLCAHCAVAVSIDNASTAALPRE